MAFPTVGYQKKVLPFPSPVNWMKIIPGAPLPTPNPEIEHLTKTSCGSNVKHVSGDEFHTGNPPLSPLSGQVRSKIFRHQLKYVTPNFPVVNTSNVDVKSTIGLRKKMARRVGAPVVAAAANPASAYIASTPAPTSPPLPVITVNFIDVFNNVRTKL